MEEDKNPKTFTSFDMRLRNRAYHTQTEDEDGKPLYTMKPDVDGILYSEEDHAHLMKNGHHDIFYRKTTEPSIFGNKTTYRYVNHAKVGGRTLNDLKGIPLWNSAMLENYKIIAVNGHGEMLYIIKPDLLNHVYFPDEMEQIINNGGNEANYVKEIKTSFLGDYTVYKYRPLPPGVTKKPSLPQTEAKVSPPVKKATLPFVKKTFASASVQKTIPKATVASQSTPKDTTESTSSESSSSSESESEEDEEIPESSEDGKDFYEIVSGRIATSMKHLDKAAKPLHKLLSGIKAGAS